VSGIASKSLPVGELLRLFPEVQELEEFALRVVSAGVPDPAKAWAKSSEYSTIDKRIVSPAAARQALEKAEESAVAQVEEIFRSCRTVLDHYWSGNAAEAAVALARLAEREEQRRRYEQARRYLDTALAVSLPLAEKRPQILALRLLGRVLWRQGELCDAALHYHRAEQLARDASDPRSEVIALTGLGNVRLFQGRWADAETLYRRALSRVEETEFAGSELQRAQLHNNLGTVTSRLNRLDEAQDWFVRALALWEEMDEPADLAICQHNFGLLHVREGNNQAARECFKQALALPVSPGIRAAIATDLALTYLPDGQVAQAKELGRVAEEHAIAARSPFVLGSMYRGLGNIARAEGDEGGIIFFEKALEIARQNEDLLLEGETLLDYAELRHVMGESEESTSYLERACEIFEQLGDRDEVERAQSLLHAWAVPTPTIEA
jgi:tetratricopeptide (TPR) repeat protein